MGLCVCVGMAMRANSCLQLGSHINTFVGLVMYSVTGGGTTELGRIGLLCVVLGERLKLLQIVFIFKSTVTILVVEFCWIDL